jgi:hypothetical protein
MSVRQLEVGMICDACTKLALTLLQPLKNKEEEEENSCARHEQMLENNSYVVVSW